MFPISRIVIFAMGIKKETQDSLMALRKKKEF